MAAKPVLVINAYLPLILVEKRGYTVRYLAHYLQPDPLVGWGAVSSVVT